MKNCQIFIGQVIIISSRCVNVLEGLCASGPQAVGWSFKIRAVLPAATTTATKRIQALLELIDTFKCRVQSTCKRGGGLNSATKVEVWHAGKTSLGPPESALTCLKSVEGSFGRYT